MPNGDHYEIRPIWEQVKYLQEELGRRADEITELTNRVAELENEKEALTLALTLTQKNESKEDSQDAPSSTD